MKVALAIWRCIYAAEHRRQLAAARMHYAREAGWCLVLVLLGAGQW
jgi:hypothetical protein